MFECIFINYHSSYCSELSFRATAPSHRSEPLLRATAPSHCSEPLLRATAPSHCSEQSLIEIELPLIEIEPTLIEIELTPVVTCKCNHLQFEAIAARAIAHKMKKGGGGEGTTLRFIAPCAMAYSVLEQLLVT